MNENEKKSKTWSWHMRTRDSVFWGIILVLGAVLLILNGLGFGIGHDLSVWRIIFGVICLVWFIERLTAGRFSEAIIPVALLFLIMEPAIATWVGRPGEKLIKDWIVIVAALLLFAGLKAIIPEKRGKGHLSSPGNRSLYFDAAEMGEKSVSDNFGLTVVYFSNIEAYTGNGKLVIHDNLGKIEIHVPQGWFLSVESHDNLGQVEVPQQSGGIYTKKLELEVHDNLGQVTVVFD